MKSIAKSWIVVAVAVVGIAVACGGDKANPLEEGGEPIATEFVDALSAGDWKRASSFLASSGSAGPEHVRLEAEGMHRNGLARVGPWSMDGAWLVAPMAGSSVETNSSSELGGEFRVLLARESGAWKVREWAYHGGFTVTLDRSTSGPATDTTQLSTPK